ncbi:hypothetical protein KDJ56_20465 [Brevibacillus composti]|uniref:Atrophied bacterial Ig domain-containing protein n=1 Tax=Brevibacillus composti TaxID=2796470 RepID=A0A7T5EK92_9BACL|nr:immunoglobulin-like domain-containing protein [Brevibacillus composti]QQE74185.1 hypothetical protein JD108_20530 [Brevibacillus composti]QUO41268.1 hypothetical protein KDJ56_20465 [Brevibacillus composti]
MNKKLVLSVLSTAVLTSMAASAMAAPKAGFYIGGEVDKYYSVDALADNFGVAFEEILDYGLDSVYVDENGKAANLMQAIFADDLDEVLADPTLALFNGNKYAIVGTNDTYDPEKDTDIVPPVDGELKVESVSAINPAELQIKFSQKVNKDSAVNLSNYVITKNGTKYGNGFNPINTLLDAAPNNIAYDEDTQTVTFRLAAANYLFNGDKYSIDVTDGVLSEDKSKKIERYAGAQQTYTDTTGPQLVKAEVTSSNFLKLTFNEPVAAGLTATVDGVNVPLAAPSTTIRDYTVQSVATLPADLRTAGTHNVSVYNATDIAAPNANSKSILTGSFQVTTDTVAPTVTEVKQSTGSDRAFDIVFSEPVTVDTSKLVIKKGNFTFPAVDANSPGYTTAFFAKDGITAVANGSVRVLRVTFGADSSAYANNLYATGENSVNLEVSVENFKDAVDLVGTKTTKTVTLSKDQAAPKVTSKFDNSIKGTLNPNATDADGYLAVKFDKAIGATVSASKITVVDKDGITRTITTAARDAADATNKTVQLVISGLTDRDNLEAKAPFTVSFAADAVTGTNGIGNVAFSTQIEKSSSTVAPVAEAVTNAVVGAGNIITVTYNTAMDASAANLANYTLDGAALPPGTTISINGTNTVVTITLPAGYTNRTISKLFAISKNVKTASGSVVVGSVATKAEYSTMLSFTDNTKPVLTGAKFLVASNTARTSDKIKLTFSEDLAAVADNPATRADFSVTVNGSAATISNLQDGTVGDDVVTLVTSAPINLSQTVVVKVNGVDATLNPVVDVTDGVGNTLTTGTEVIVSGTELDAGQIAQDAADVATAKAALAVGYAGGDSAASVTQNLTLTTTGASATTVTWSSDNTAVVTNAGVVTRPSYNDGDAAVNLTATITKGTATDTKTFALTVKAEAIDADSTVTDGAKVGINADATVTIALVDEAGNPVTGLTNADFVLAKATGTGKLTFGAVTETATPGTYTFTVQNDTAETATISITVDGVLLSDTATLDSTL